MEVPLLKSLLLLLLLLLLSLSLSLPLSLLLLLLLLMPYMGHIGMCRCEGYGFQAVYSSIGYINQSVWV